MGEGLVATAACGDEQGIATDDGLLRRFSWVGAERTLPKDRLRFLEIALDEELYFVPGSGEVDNPHLAAEAVKDVIASDDDAAARVEDQVAVRIVLQMGENFIEDGDFLTEVFGFALRVSRAVWPAHPSGNTVDAGVAARPEDSR